MNTDQFQVKIEEQQFDLFAKDLEGLDMIPTDDGQYHILQDGKSYHVELETFHAAAKQITLRVNGNKYELSIADHYDLLVKKMGLSVGATQKITEVKAPMPGMVLDILVAPEQEVTKGDSLLILEAMKMENVIKADGDGKVKMVNVQKGKPVDKGQVLIEMY